MGQERRTIILADDHEIMLDGLVSIINTEPSLVVADLARNGSELIEKVEIFKPDLCIVDIDMPVMNGIRASEELLRRNKDVRIIILTMHKEKSLEKRLERMGVRGYMLKTCDSDELLFSIHQVLKGKAYFSNIKSEWGDKTSDGCNTDIARIALLTKRELEILKLLCGGYSNSKIAACLFISPSTVDNHRTSIMRKLEVHNIVELTRLCIENSLV